MKIGLIYSDKLKNYDFGIGHPFRGSRFESFMTYFQEKLKGSGRFDVVLSDEPASDEDLTLWHKKDYIRVMQEASAGKFISDLWRYISPDNMNPRTRSFPEAIEAAARVIVRNSMFACQLVQEGKYEKAVSIGGGLHHAKPSYGEGFCVYNDVVISVKHLIRKYALDRILVLDTDAHAGNGTCEAFYSDPKVLFVDIHQRSIYPGTGYANEVGEGEGRGYTVNVPMPPYASDGAYELVFDELVFPLAEEFKPQIILRNGGSDPHPNDSITQLGLTLDGFKYVGKSVREISDVCDGKQVDLICSGYEPQVLARAWLALISGLANIDIELEEPFPLKIEKNQMLGEMERIINKVKKNLKPHWKSMNN